MPPHTVDKPQDVPPRLPPLTPTPSCTSLPRNAAGPGVCCEPAHHGRGDGCGFWGWDTDCDLCLASRLSPLALVTQAARLERFLWQELRTTPGRHPARRGGLSPTAHKARISHVTLGADTDPSSASSARPVLTNTSVAPGGP